MVETLTKPREFDTKRDSELITAGTHFWCEACLTAKPLSERSTDPRYCQSCHDFLTKEAETMHPSRRPSWMPRPQKTPGNTHQASPEQNLAQKTTVAASSCGASIKSPTVSKQGKRPRQLALSMNTRGRTLNPVKIEEARRNRRKGKR